MTEIKLKNCPCCPEGEARFSTRNFSIHTSASGEIAVMCRNCKLSTDYIPISADYAAKEKAAELWNTRVESKTVESTIVPDDFDWVGFAETLGQLYVFMDKLAVANRR